MKYEIPIRKPDGQDVTLTVEAGRSIVIVGANGSGKTRLGVHVEATIPAKSVHRIAAQKSLTLNNAVQLMSLERAETMLRFGVADGAEAHKSGSRWGNRPAVFLLNDFDALLLRLFAENNRVALTDREARKKDPTVSFTASKLEQLKELWDALLPHRALRLLEASIEVVTQKAGELPYAGSDMSDGERAIFYFLGQCLVAPDDCVIIIDEPEGHVHKAILGPLWDAIEKVRPDCGFLYITHDLDFAVTRPAAARYFIRTYTHDPQSWDIALLPMDTGLPDNVVVEIVGSRKPILFVEGERGSLDVTIYRHHYAAFTVVPIGSCEDVIHSVASFKRNGTLHWLNAKGLVDADHRTGEQIAALQGKQVYVLPVAEVENVLLLPGVFAALAEAQSLDPDERLKTLTEKVLQNAQQQVESVSARFTSRQLDERLKGLSHAASDLATLQTKYESGIARIDLAATFNEFKAVFEQAIAKPDLPLVLKLFDNKTLLSLAAGTLGLKNAPELMERVERLLGDKEKGLKLRAALQTYLPAIPVPTAVAPAQNRGALQVAEPIAAAPVGSPL
jgi:energy-coupling factor transporter ATP-binding protein EcfA2